MLGRTVSRASPIACALTTSVAPRQAAASSNAQRHGGGGKAPRGPGKWSAAAPSAKFLASLRPVTNNGSNGARGGGAPPVVLGPVGPPPVPFDLAPPPVQALPGPPPVQPRAEPLQQPPASNRSAAQLLRERMLAGAHRERPQQVPCLLSATGPKAATCQCQKRDMCKSSAALTKSLCAGTKRVPPEAEADGPACAKRKRTAPDADMEDARAPAAAGGTTADAADGDNTAAPSGQMAGVKLENGDAKDGELGNGEANGKLEGAADAPGGGDSGAAAAAEAAGPEAAAAYWAQLQGGPADAAGEAPKVCALF